MADRLYEHNVPLMKRLKKMFATVEAHYKAESLRTEDSALVSFYGACSRLFASFGLWLEETRLNQSNSSQYSEYPPQYDANRLASIFAGANVGNMQEMIILVDYKIVFGFLELLDGIPSFTNGSSDTTG